MGHQEAKRSSVGSAFFSDPFEPAPVADAPSSSTSRNVDKDFTIKVADVLQGLICLNNLLHANAADPAKVRVYANLAEERVRALGELLRPMLWNSICHGERS